MKKSTMFALISVFLFVTCTDIFAAELNPNGFPSGDHYNLNIHGKKDSYSCSEQEYDVYGKPIYGNSVFVPENGQGSIYVESGKGKRAEAITELQVTDPCAFDGNGATLQLPPKKNGYNVYARVLAKPTGEPYIGLESSLYMVQDEDGNDLLYLGLVTDRGFETTTVSVTRKKGKSKAVDISGMFQWSGSVCYFEEPADGYESSSTVCCVDSNGNGDLDECPLAKVDDTTDLLTCEVGSVELTTYCKSFTAEWIFNAADYITMLMESNNNGVKLLQIRFYPN
jgi:hypothetical protein